MLGRRALPSGVPQRGCRVGDPVRAPRSGIYATIHWDGTLGCARARDAISFVVRFHIMRNVFTLTAAMLAVGVSIGHGQTNASSPVKSATVYKQVGCGCCSIWAEHLRKAGFKVSSMEVNDLARIKNTYGVPQAAHTCHTALIDGYVFEGHVPIDLVQKVLKERPRIAGLAVPGMPIGSPGMESGSRKDPYDVLAFDREGKTTVYAKQ